MNFKKKSFKRLDFTLILTVLLLCIYGIVMIKSATLTFPTNSKVKAQILSTILGFVAIFIIVLLDYEFIGNLYIPIYLVSVGLLLATELWGFGGADWGADSWLSIGGFIFQPTEFSKVGFTIFLAKYMAINKQQINNPVVLLKILILTGIPVALILRQPDLGTSVVFVFILAVMLFVAGLDWKYIGAAMVLGIGSLPIIWRRLGNYQKDRIYSFLYPELYKNDKAFQANQARIAIGSGKVFGRGLFKGGQTQYNFIPEKQTDFIFAVIGEELGLIGGGVLIFLYTIMLLRLLKIAKNSKDPFGSLMVSGFAAMFLVHIWENIGMNIGLMPITGIPLPFISHGGTFQLINLICIGIALSVGVHKDGLQFK